MKMKYARLSLMMFLLFMMLPVWFVPMFPYVQAMPGGGDWAVWCGLIMGFGTFTSPLFGMFADRFLNAERVLAVCNFLGALLLGRIDERALRLIFAGITVWSGISMLT